MNSMRFGALAAALVLLRTCGPTDSRTSGLADWFASAPVAQQMIDAGTRADLVLLDANPLVDIRNTRRIAAVVVRGRVLLKPDLDRLLAAHRR